MATNDTTTKPAPAPWLIQRFDEYLGWVTFAERPGRRTAAARLAKAMKAVPTAAFRIVKESN